MGVPWGPLRAGLLLIKHRAVCLNDVELSVFHLLRVFWGLCVYLRFFLFNAFGFQNPPLLQVLLACVCPISSCFFFPSFPASFWIEFSNDSLFTITIGF